MTVRLDIDAEGELTDWEFMLSTIRPVAEIQPDHLVALANRKPKARTVPAALKGSRISCRSWRRFSSAHDRFRNVIAVMG